MKILTIKIIGLLSSIIIIGVIIFLIFKNKKTNELFSNNSEIPKMLHRTLLWDNEIPSSVKNTYDTFNTQNEQNGWKIKLWRSDEVKELMNKYNLLEIYNSLNHCRHINVFPIHFSSVFRLS